MRRVVSVIAATVIMAVLTVIICLPAAYAGQEDSTGPIEQPEEESFSLPSQSASSQTSPAPDWLAAPAPQSAPTPVSSDSSAAGTGDIKQQTAGSTSSRVASENAQGPPSPAGTSEPRDEDADPDDQGPTAQPGSGGTSPAASSSGQGSATPSSTEARDGKQSSSEGGSKQSSSGGGSNQSSSDDSSNQSSSEDPSSVQTRPASNTSFPLLLGALPVLAIVGLGWFVVRRFL